MKRRKFVVQPLILMPVVCNLFIFKECDFNQFAHCNNYDFIFWGKQKVTVFRIKLIPLLGAINERPIILHPGLQTDYF